MSGRTRPFAPSSSTGAAPSRPGTRSTSRAAVARLCRRRYAADPEHARAIAERIMAAEERRLEAPARGRRQRPARRDPGGGRRRHRPSGAQRAQAAYEEFWEPHTFTDADVLPLFTALRERGIKVGVLSNTIWSREYHEAVFARDGVLDLDRRGGLQLGDPARQAAPGRVRRGPARRGRRRPGGRRLRGDRPYEDVHGAQRAACARCSCRTRTSRRNSRCRSTSGPTPSSTRLARRRSTVRRPLARRPPTAP